MNIREIFQYVLGSLIVVGFFLILYVVFISVMPDANKDIGLLVIGALVAKFGDVVAYFFGSSKGSADKTDMIRNNSKNL